MAVDEIDRLAIRECLGFGSKMPRSDEAGTRSSFRMHHPKKLSNRFHAYRAGFPSLALNDDGHWAMRRFP